jgi:hypothetical protein
MQWCCHKVRFDAGGSPLNLLRTILRSADPGHLPMEMTIAILATAARASRITGACLKRLRGCSFQVEEPEMAISVKVGKAINVKSH